MIRKSSKTALHIQLNNCSVPFRVVLSIWGKKLQFKVSTKSEQFVVHATLYIRENKKSIICASLSKRQSSIWLYAWLSDLVRKASPNKIIKRKVRHHDCVKSIHSYRVYHFLYLGYVFLLFTPKSITAV